MESLLKEYPISSAEGLALMRLAEALLRVPDAETAIALTADQLGRADFDGDLTRRHRLRWPGCHPPPSPCPRNFCPRRPEPGLMAKLGARTVVAATLRAVQLLGRQFVLGQTMARPWARPPARAAPPTCRFSYDMLGEGARTDADALRYLASYQNAIQASPGRPTRPGAVAHNDGISIKLSALHPRYEDAQRERVLAELVPRVWTLCEQAARANINLTIDAEEVDRLELSLDVFEALAAKVAQHHPQWAGFGLACRLPDPRAGADRTCGAMAWPANTACASCAAWSRARTGTPRSSAPRSWACRTTPCSPTSTTPM
jgi:RHH-type proline utilization regulon transcriptional repressor/proline dehydrogenase/delta 1-pyrroline-5-carboxylate dehydrogenase